MEWYESLFLQMCAHVLSGARTADITRVDKRLNFEIASTRRIVAAYRKEAELAHDTHSVLKKFSSGAEFVVLVLVREHQPSKALEKLKEKCNVMLSATMETDAQARAVPNYYVDVAICRPFGVARSAQ